VGATVILPDLFLQTTINQQWKTSGLDSFDKCLNKKHFLDYPHTVEYHYNSRGFRDAEWPNTIEELQNAIWCVGDSFTVGLGSPYEFTWPQVLAKVTGRRCINVSMDGASNAWISRRAQQIIKEVAPKQLVVLWSYTHRRESPDINLSDEARRLQFEKSNLELDDLKNFINCYTNLKNCSAGTNIFNGMIPHSGFPNMDNFYNHNQLTKLFNLDYARDYHHFDRVTSEFFVKQILKNLDS
jgi:hypothetical protein